MAMWQCAQSPNPSLRESALFIFGIVPALFGDNLETYIAEIKLLLQTSLQDTTNFNVCISEPQPERCQLSQVQLAAAQALSSFVLVLERTQRGAFTELLPVVLDVSQTDFTILSNCWFRS